ncbi:MAG: hypothetical protein ABIN89_27030 [Chitinophagaceae bacterium]
MVLSPKSLKTKMETFGLEAVVVEFADTMEKPSHVLPQKTD